MRGKYRLLSWQFRKNTFIGCNIRCNPLALNLSSQNILHRTFGAQRQASHDEQGCNDTESTENNKQKASSSGNAMAFAFKAIFASPLIFLFGAVMFGQSKQGYEMGKLPEQYQFFRRYICGHSQLLDELGAPIKISAGSTDIEVQSDDELKFNFGIEGDYGKGTVHCHRLIQTVTEQTEDNQGFDQETKLKITVDTQTDLGNNSINVIDKISYQ